MKKIFIPMIIAMSILACSSISLANIDEGLDRLSYGTAYTFGSGYINAARYHASQVIAQAVKPNSAGMLSQMMDKIRYSAERTIQAANNLVQPVLQRKSSSGKGSKNSRLSGAQLIDSTQYNVDLTAPGWTNLGNGMISRVIDGVHHIYVEHGSAVTSSTSTIQDAIELMGNSGGIVLVAGGAYSGDISVTNGVKLYGGYDQHGNRNLTASATTIQGTFSVDGTTYADFANTGVPMGTVDAITEINGFTITNDLTAAITIGAHNADKLRILNNDIQYSFRGIYANNTTGALIFNNSITSSNGDVSGKGAGIFTDHSSLNITNNIIKYGEHGLLEESHSSSIFSNNFIWDVVKHGVVVRGGSTTTITNNTFYNTCNADAIHLNNSYPSIGKNAYVGNYGVVNIEDDKHKQDGATGRSQYNPIDDAPPIVAPVIIGFDPVNKIFDLPGLSGKGYSFDAGKTARDTYDRMQSVTYSNPAGSYYTPPEYNNPLLTSDFGKSTFSLFGGLGQDGALQNIFASGKGSSKEDALDMGAVLKSLLKGRGEGSDSNSPLTTVQIARMVDQAFNQSAIAVPVYAKRAQAGEDAAVLKLSNILNNPTDMQKMIIDAVTAVMAQAEDTASDQVKKAADGFYRAAANAMLTQALPDILRDGDVANIKSLFSDLSNTKNRILAEYYETTKPYYDKTIKCLEKNMSFLQLNNILAKNMLESELENLPRSEIDRIIQKIKRLDKKAFETDYILQEEAKYRKAYIDPSKDALKDSFTGLLDDFTKKINIALDEARNRK